MTYIDLLQELGRVRRALEDLIAATSGPGTKDLLTKRDAITTLMNQVVDDRSVLETVAVSTATATVDDVAATLAGLISSTKDISKAVALADRATAAVDAVLAPIVRRRTTAAAVRTLLASASPDSQRFTAFCNTHEAAIPQTKVTLDRAIQNEADHLAIAENAGHDVVIIPVK